MVDQVSTGRVKVTRRLRNRKFRAASGEFVVEGAQACREAVRCGAAQRVLATEAAAQQYPEIVAGGFERLLPGQVGELTTTVTPQGIFAICHLAPVSLAELVADAPRLVVICAQVRDPGNLGTVIRCADAFGADAVIVTTGSVDPTGPKAVRASVGSLFHLPVVSGVDLGEAVAAVKRAGLAVLAADARGEGLNDLAAGGDLARPIAWLIGNEAWGLPEPDVALADRRVAIPMWGRAESLNLSTAAAICLYATASAQRHQDSTGGNSGDR